MMEHEAAPMTEESVAQLLRETGAEVKSRSGRTEHYGAPREYSFEVRAKFDNGLELQVLARQFGYRDPWEMEGRVNDCIDVSLLREGSYDTLPKGYPFFQGTDIEEGVDEVGLREIAAAVRDINPKIYLLQKLTGDY